MTVLEMGILLTTSNFIEYLWLAMWERIIINEIDVCCGWRWRDRYELMAMVAINEINDAKKPKIDEIVIIGA